MSPSRARVVATKRDWKGYSLDNESGRRQRSNDVIGESLTPNIQISKTGYSARRDVLKCASERSRELDVLLRELNDKRPASSESNTQS